MSVSITARTTFELQDSASAPIERDVALLREAAAMVGQEIDESTWDIDTDEVDDINLGNALAAESIPTWRTITVSTLPRKVDL